MNAAMYKMVLQKQLKASMKMTDTEVFMQGGAPCHTARSVTIWLKDKANVRVLDWIGQSCEPLAGAQADHCGYLGRYKPD